MGLARILATTLLLALLVPARADDLFQRATLTGDWGGIGSRLEQDGIQLGGDEIVETLGNPRGGRDHDAAVEGRFELFTTVDLEQALGWRGALFHANLYQIHGRGLQNDLGSLVTPSNIESEPATRPFGLWLQQSFAGDTVSLRAGQIAADDEFFVSQYAPLFVNSSFGWPSILGINLPGGGPSYPLARPGARVRLALSPRLTLSGAVFSGDGHADAGGLNVHIDGSAFVIGEAAYGITLNELPGTVKLGGWYHSGHFADQRFGAGGTLLAAGGVPALHHGDYGGYFIVDQLLWRNSGTSDAGLGAFLRIAGAPAERNLIAFHMDGGLTYAGPFGRDSDVIGIGLSLEEASIAQRDLTGDFRALTGLAAPYPDFESTLELSWQTQIAPWWIVQPDVQWVMHPGARVLDISRPLEREGDALVLGLRTAVAL
jgi:porin